MSEDGESFKDAPQSITEIRADREGDMRIWTPRDILIATLRDIDNGMKIDAMVISYRVLEGEDTFTRQAKACPDIQTALGLVHRTAHIIQRQWDGE